MSKIMVSRLLSFGDEESCAPAATDTAVVHACKHPCHCAAVGYAGKIDPAHPNYLAKQRANHLFLNIIDPPLPLFKPELFQIFFTFLDDWISGAEEARPIHIHCNRGESRAPSLALLLMAKRMEALPNESYAAARAVFETKFPYKPGEGIAKYLTDNWDNLGT
jgi:predicted protein tyrosine phosphatase